ncbi:HAD family hydrolase [Salidesulfovibrio onnuriiensis]|uniref:HAD family hydrolase n=1 Tax=Salidesulfovibrio onnuriiensis TaxID=2583823 RepID=UPI0011C9A498|nr:HAD family hydrolase [Salidesulfovibrio onnuriiensis]
MGFKGVVFDMDDVVYLEREYVRSGFQAVARALSEERNGEIFDLLWTMLGQECGQDVFSRLLSERPELGGGWTAEDLGEIYWTHEPEITLLPSIRALVEELQDRGVKCGLVSDGDCEVQERKARALGADELFDAVLLTHRFDREPWKLSSLCLDFVAHNMDLLNETLVYVGDNPVKDFLGAQKLGWSSVLLEQPGQFRDQEATPLAAPSHTVEGVEALRELLLGMTRES